MTKGFRREIIDFLIEKIENYEGQMLYGCDLAHELTLDENNDGCWVMYISRANEFVSRYRKDALETLQYFRDNFGNEYTDKQLEIGEYAEWDEVDYEDCIDEIDMIEENNKSELFTFMMLYYGVEQLINNLSCVSKVWDVEFEITPQFINRFTREL